jgi:hypothetical protein
MFDLDIRASELASKARQIAKTHEWDGTDPSDIGKAVELALINRGIGEEDDDYNDLRIGAEIRLSQMLQLDGIFKK